MVKFLSASAFALSAIGAVVADVVDLTGENFDATLKEKDLAIVKFFAPWCGHCKSMAGDWEKASNAIKDNEKAMIANVDCTEHRELCGSQSVSGYPTLKAFKNGVFFEETYDRREADIVKYVNNFFGDSAGADATDEAPKDVKSEDIPDDSEYTASNVWKIVGNNFQDRVINSDKHVFLKVYAPWCGHCVAMAETWDEFAKAMEGRDDVVVAKIDATANELPTSYNVRGFPTIWWADKGNKATPEKYQGARSVDAWTAFVDKKAGSGKDEL